MGLAFRTPSATSPTLPAPAAPPRAHTIAHGRRQLPLARVAQAADPFAWTGSDEFTALGDRVDAPPLPLPRIARRRRVVLVRHGQSTWNAEGRIQGSSDFSELTPKGVGQAQITRDMVRPRAPSRRGVRVCACVRATAHIRVLRAWGRRMRVDAACGPRRHACGRAPYSSGAPHRGRPPPHTTHSAHLVRTRIRIQTLQLKDEKFDALFVSPLKRARQTAEIVTEGLGLKPRVLPSLREIDLYSFQVRAYNLMCMYVCVRMCAHVYMHPYVKVHAHQRVF